MALTDQDRIDITDLINLHGHLTDAGERIEAARLFTTDATYDLTDFGLGAPKGVETRDIANVAHPVGHHVTNTVITSIDDRSARVRSKGIGIRADGTAGSVVYDDVVTRHPDGWKISHRKVTARRAPLGTRAAGPREVLDRFRQAAIARSVEDMGALYAADAVLEFPFTRPGVPSRLDGRDAIVGWIAEGWDTRTLRYERYRTHAIHETGDPNTIIVEQDAVGTSTVTGEFALPNLLVLTVRNGLISHLRDYVNVLAASAAMGRAG